MITRWWHALRRRREDAVLRRRAVPDALWHRILQSYPFLGRRAPGDVDALRRLSSLFLDRKEFSGAGGLEMSDEMAVAIAAQACLPVLQLGLSGYDGFVGIVVHPVQVSVEREFTDAAGVVHRYDEVLAGEAMDGGPMMLSWADVQAAGADEGSAYNVVIHEFAHVLDLVDGVADGMPLQPSVQAARQWQQVLMPEYDRFSERVACGYDTVVDPYGAQSPDEFFAVAVEAFFVAPQGLKEEQPALYRLFSNYFRQDPAAF